MLKYWRIALQMWFIVGVLLYHLQLPFKICSLIPYAYNYFYPLSLSFAFISFIIFLHIHFELNFLCCLISFQKRLLQLSTTSNIPRNSHIFTQLREQSSHFHSNGCFHFSQSWTSLIIQLFHHHRIGVFHIKSQYFSKLVFLINVWIGCSQTLCDSCERGKMRL